MKEKFTSIEVIDKFSLEEVLSNLAIKILEVRVMRDQDGISGRETPEVAIADN